MASNHHNPPRNPSTPQSIPLQDLTRSSPSSDGNDRRHRRRASGSDSGRGRNLLRGGESGSAFGRRYEPLTEASPSPTERRSALTRPYVSTPSGAHQPPYIDDGDPDERDSWPMEDPVAFQAATGFAGLDFGNEPTYQTPPGGDRGNLELITGADDAPGFSAYGHPYGRSSFESHSYFEPADTDSTPLTQPQHLQPMAGLDRRSSGGQDHDRTSFQSVRFSSPGSPRGMLGDDLPRAEAGLGGSASRESITRSGTQRGRQRSLSPSSAGSPLSKASSMVRKMSQRIVNLSNEPELVEQSMRRKASEREARLTGPPSLPAMLMHAHDEPASAESPIEKTPSLVRVRKAQQREEKEQANPLRGQTLGIFPPENKLRVWLCDILVHPLTEPVILILILVQTVLLAIESGPNVYSNPRPDRWGSSWIDYALFGLFVTYTLEIIVRVIVSGFIMNPIEFSTIDRRKGYRVAVAEHIRGLWDPQHRPSNARSPNPMEMQQPSIIRTFTATQPQLDQPGHSTHQQRVRLARRAFLRHGFNRLDFVAVISFWISFVLGVMGQESPNHLYIFKMLSCLRIVRLLGLTSGTSVILRSLKKAAPSLLNVAFLISFFWLLFAIIAVQIFKGSFRRNCHWFDPDGLDPNQGLPTPNGGTLQFCGGHLNSSGDAQPWLDSNLQVKGGTHKGYLCPVESKCIEGKNPYNGTVHFDNVLNSLQLIFVIMSSNTFSDLLYYTTETDYMTSALFFAAAFVIMSLWLMNLLVAVITSSFQVIREESKASAFTTDEEEIPLNDDEEEDASPRRVGSIKRVYDKTRWIWIFVIIFALIVQSLRTADMTPGQESFIDNTETAVTLLLLVEILIRFAADWRNFHKCKRNLVDLGLAIITTIIQIPPIHKSGEAYAWLTFFQIVRIYRPVLAVSVTRELIMMVLGNVSGLLNLILFVFLVTFLTAIFAVQIFRGEIEETDANGNANQVTFATIYNSFLGMYQILSSENWTSVMYTVTSYTTQHNIAWIGAVFFVLWFILANFIVLNMFIAVIQENFDVTEDEKRLQQFKAFLQRRELSGSSHSNLSLATIFKMGRKGGQKDPLDYGPASLEMLLQDRVVRDFLAEQMEPLEANDTQGASTDTKNSSYEARLGPFSALWDKLIGFYKNREPNPFYARLYQANDDLDPRTMAKEVVNATVDRKRAQREYLVKHPKYNNSLFIFAPSNPLRKLCQSVVGPGRGHQRFGGVEPVKPVWYTFSAFIYAAIVAMVILACITTPLFQKEWSEKYNMPIGRNWFVYTDLGFAILFSVEALIKVVADGFFWTPNAYFRGSWGFIDGLVLTTLWIDVITSLIGRGSVSRAVGAFKALRALRLLNISDSARDTFHSVIVLGGWKVISAAFVSLSLLIPFAIYGLNLFSGKMMSCNDSGPNISSLPRHCVGEYTTNIYNFEVRSPRVISNSYYDFDNFGGALFILFQIVSQEGWTDVMWSAESIIGPQSQPRPFASQGNALFFVVFNLLGAVFVLTLFVSVFMRNYTEQTGVAFLTAEQRSWLELRKLLQQISPSKRPSNKPNRKWREWCYRQAVKKHGPWQRFVTFVLFLHLALLVIEYYPMSTWWNRVRDFLFLAFTVFYIVNIIVRIIGLTWTRFRKSSWDLYSLFAVTGTFITTVLLISDFRQLTYEQLHKLFLVSIALLLIPRNNQLDQLFKTAAASLNAIGNLLATWFVLFVVYAIALTQTLGLTKFGPNEDGNLNFRNVPKALILLFRMSCGEGWNEIMNDYASMTEPLCTRSEDFTKDDCGSSQWAHALFISWNILSMYIFVSLFVSLIFESFSYVYQRSTGISAVSREEIRRFKQAWATFDPRGTGFISKEAFPRLLGELSGVFEMRIYEGEFTVQQILEDCRQEPTLSRRNSGAIPGVVEGVDVRKLASRISQIPILEIRRRRQRLNVFYEDVMVSADADRGISFTAILMLLVHHKVISDNKHLRLEEYLRRRQRMQRVEEEVRRNIVRGFFDTIHWSRHLQRILDSKEQARLQTIPTFAVPEILVDDEEDRSAANYPGAGPSSSPQHSPESVRRSQFLHTIDTDVGSADGSRSSRNRAGSHPLSPTTVVSGHNRLSPQASPRHSAYADGFDHQEGGVLGYHTGTSSGSVPETRSRQNSVLDAIDNSAWGDSIRRSFTIRRGGRPG
ncbi:MAG: calcium channel protein [Sclerophora amabilis]|nr:MAG: calcium channel protein [Sclerophora amabilis]